MPSFHRVSTRSAVLPAALLAACLATPAAAERQEVRKLEKRLVLGDAGQVHVDLSFGSLTVEGTRGHEVEVELALDCSREDLELCKERAERVRLAPRMKRKELLIKLKHTPGARLGGIHARMTVRMPSHYPLEVDVRGGSVYVTGLISHIDVNSGGGDVDVLATRAGTGEVEVDVGFGKADLWLGDGRIEGTGWPKALNWKGSGQAVIEIDVVGSGDVSVRLE